MGKLYLAAPQGTRWPLDLDEAELRLRERWPEIMLTRPTGAVDGQPYLSFDVSANGAPRYGTYADQFCLTLAEGSPEDWAETIAWFLDLLPPGTPAVAMVEEDPNVIVPVPAGASTEQIRDLYQRLVTPQ